MRTKRRPSRDAPSRNSAPVEPVRALLDNGLAVVLCPRAGLSQSYVAFLSQVGSRLETKQNNGISHMLEHMMFRGTRHFPSATALNAAAEGFGGFLEGATYRDHMVFATACHHSALMEAITILSELIQTPRYRAIEVERAILREELLETLDSQGRMVDLDNIAHRMVFGAHHGLGLPIEGTLTNVERLNRGELDAHRVRYLTGANSVLCLAGPMVVPSALKWVERAFGELDSGRPPIVPEPPPPGLDPVVRYVRDAASQVDIRISFRAAPAFDPDYPAMVMLARVLADGLASRMHAELVDRQGLAYAIHAGLTTYADTGLFEFEVSVAPDRAARAVSGILRFATAAARFRFATAELQRVRRRYRYGIEFMADSPVDLVNWHGRAALFGVERHFARLGMRMAQLRDAEIRRAARRLFCRRGMVVTAVGELARGQWQAVRRVVEDWPGHAG